MSNPIHPCPEASIGGIRLLGDVGGTNARFAVVAPSCKDLCCVQVLKCADYPGPAEAIAAYQSIAGIGEVRSICLALAGPTDGDVATLPNSTWTVERCELEAKVGAPVLLVNDFTAQALSIDALGPDDLTWIGDPRPDPNGIRTVLGPGTGLGVAVQMPNGPIVPSEGGHIGFAPADEHQVDLLRALMRRYGRVSAERLLSGPGLENIYWANGEIEGDGVERGTVTAAEVSALAASGDARGSSSVADFLDALASFAGDAALFNWSTGGVYLSGGVLRSLAAFIDLERFRRRFEAKGRFTQFCRSVPLAWVTHAHPGLLGCAVALDRAERRTAHT